MNIVLLSEHISKAQFIQHGLKFENLDCEVLSLQSVYLHTDLLNGVYGIFIFLKDPTCAEEVLKNLFLPPDLIVVILSETYHQNLMELLYDKKIINNYFTRPFPFRLIASDMRARIFRKRESLTDKIIKIRELEINREMRVASLDGNILPLSQKEYALLEFLMLHQGKALTRQTILEEVWDRNADIFTNTVDVHINKLRKKMGKKNTYIKTAPRIGYTLN